MTKKFIDRVTITGADNSIKQEDIVALSQEFPFVEWGILLSRKSEGKNRFPDYAWLLRLNHVWKEIIETAKPGTNPFALCGHICGAWVRDICKGNWSILSDCSEIEPMFGRFQLNFHALVHDLDQQMFIKAFDDPRLWFRQFIFQLDDINNDILDVAKAADIDAVGLFDTSGGIGRLPEEWPVAKGYCGYAGGLSPENLEIVIEDIQQVCGPGPIWIDVETKIRSEDDQQFDLGKVRAFLEISQQWVIEKEGVVA